MKSNHVFRSGVHSYQDHFSDYLDIILHSSYNVLELHLVIAGTEYSAAEPLTAVIPSGEEQTEWITEIKEGNIAEISIDFEVHPPAYPDIQSEQPTLTAELSLDPDSILTIEGRDILWFHLRLLAWQMRPIQLSS
jgi:hypothetical protein